MSASRRRRFWLLAALVLGAPVCSLVAFVSLWPSDIWDAVELGNTWRARIMLKLEPSLLDARAKNGDSLLHEAAWRGHRKLVEHLLDAGLDVNVRGNLGRTPLHRAAQWGQADVVRLLIDRGADVNARDSLLRTPLHVALLDSPYADEVVPVLLAARAQPDTQDQDGYTPLHCAVMMRNWVAVKELLDAGADPNIGDEVGATPLYLAAERGYSDVALLLLDGGADPHIVTSGGSTVMDAAATGGNEEIALMLRDAGLEDNILSAAAFGELRLVQRLLRDDPSLARYKGAYNITPLHLAARGGHVEVAKVLIEHGADVNARDMIHGTPLDLAPGHPEVFALLREHGALRGSDLDTPDAR